MGGFGHALLQHAYDDFANHPPESRRGDSDEVKALKAKLKQTVMSVRRLSYNISGFTQGHTSLAVLNGCISDCLGFVEDEHDCTYRIETKYEIVNDQIVEKK